MELILPRFAAKVSAHWRPVYIEPIRHSGERITIAIIYRTIDNEKKIIPTLPKEHFKKLLGPDGRAFANLIDTVISELGSLLSRSSNLEQLKSSFSGVIIGETGESVDLSFDSIVDHTIRNVSFFSSFSEALSSVTDKHDRHTNTWFKDVNEHILALRPTIKQNFRRQVRLRESARMTTLDYVGNNIAFNFSSLDPTSSSFSAQQNRIMKRATELNSFRQNFQIAGNDYSHLEVNIWTPKRTELGKKQSRNLVEATEELSQLGDDIKVRIVTGQDLPRLEKMILSDLRA